MNIKISTMLCLIAVGMLAVGTIALAGEIRIDSAGGSTMAYITDDGRVENASRSTIGNQQARSPRVACSRQ